ncbi:MAG: UDP-2,3-diacylglucosamine diphosphatase [Gammaproteobacteria bacterium]|nr:UDP-2,3-diacylglucosamine diphosphatase [Gammaproteobacteria bacterium]MDH5799177.1 UDP-2,3-diacylglucosamine diphosphatase [Gammaproteobacteria bacterium]
MTTLFISDLHLTAKQAGTIDLFCRFLQDQAAHTEHLYILGDLFEYWIGDDYIEPGLEKVLQALNQFSALCPVDVMHGNRDFLLGSQFEKLSGCRLIDDPSVIQLWGETTLLMHGDSMCIDDVEYMKLRQQFRDPNTQRMLLSKTVEERLQIAGSLRQQSSEANRYKTEDIMDVNQHCVKQTMQQYQATRLIHGHTHRPGVHSFHIESKTVQRIVLGDWYHQGSVLRCNELGCELLTVPMSA